MTWELSYNLDIDKYSGLIAVGGDGTYHEVVNGMLHRPDKRRLPVGYLPNGSGNDTLRSFWINDLTKALDYIVKGDLLKVDLVKVLIDHETEESISEKDRVACLRYQLINSSYSIPARVNLGAKKWKSCCCNAYEVAAFFEFLKIKYETVDIYVNGELACADLTTPFLMGFTGKHGGNNMLINPLGVINDGQMEIIAMEGKTGVREMVKVMD